MCSLARGRWISEAESSSQQHAEALEGAVLVYCQADRSA